MNSFHTEKEQTLLGVGASPGIVIGRALMIRVDGPARKINLRDTDVAAEQDRFRQAVNRTEENLRHTRQEFAAVIAEHITIIDSHILMLRDGMLFDRTLEIIEKEKVNAEWALEQSLSRIKEIFSKVNDSYIRERFLDVRQVAEQIFTELAGTDKFPHEIDEKVILVSRDFSPADILHMQGLSGFISEGGGETSHSAIVARTLGIPAVVGLKDVTRQVGNGDLLILDGITGRVIINPQPELIEQYRERQRQYLSYSKDIARFALFRPETLDGLSVRVQANIELVEEVSQALEYGACGIGLFRSEYLYLKENGLPDEEMLFEAYRNLLSHAAPLPVTIRALDIGGDKHFPVQQEELSGRFHEKSSRYSEANPALGLRAIRYLLHEPSVFVTQLRAMLRASTFGELRILFPLISAYCELEKVKKMVSEVQESLRNEGIPFSENVQFGVMIEVPSAVALADNLAHEVDFFSIGTNDLIQYALAIDRSNEHVAHMYESLHPAVLRMIRHVAEAGHRAGIEVGICGEMAGNTMYLPILLGLGLDFFSMHPLAIPYVKRMIRNSTAEELEELAEDLLVYPSASQIRNHLQEYLFSHYPEEFPRL
ncbi:MAG: phosphoenolpyruvate--protein phosphotransferase [Desulfobulbaceae bacterium]|nr:phosphoenolpyruvate--protein phosphotransferase [Desulfobulbaceae bacterium]